MKHLTSISTSVALVVLGALGMVATPVLAEAKPVAPVPDHGKDTTPPTIVCPPDITREATGPQGELVTFSASVTDNSDPSPTVTYSPASGSRFPIATTTVTVTAKDRKGNTSKGTFKVTVRDTTPPALVCPSDIFRNANDPGGAVVTFAASVSDLVDPSPTITYSTASGSTFPEGTTTVTVRAVDRSGNAATGTFQVTYDADPTECPFAGSYTHSWIRWDYFSNDPLVAFEWTFTIAPDGTVSGQGVQTAVALVYADYDWTGFNALGYMPMPSDISHSVSADGHMTDAGSVQLESVFNEWVYVIGYDSYELYPPYVLTMGGQASLDAEGNLVFDNGDVWYRQ